MMGLMIVAACALCAAVVVPSVVSWIDRADKQEDWTDPTTWGLARGEG